MDYRDATEADDELLIDDYVEVWKSYGIPPAALMDDHRDRVRAFLSDGRKHYQLGAIIASEAGEKVGSCSYQLQLSPFPEVMRPQLRRLGYIWTVYVKPEWRRQGVAKRLTGDAVDRLRRMGCTDAVLHASDAGEPVYQGLGFRLAKEMRLKLREPPKS